MTFPGPALGAGSEEGVTHNSAECEGEMIAVEGQYMAPHTFVELLPTVVLPLPPEITKLS